MIETHPEKRLIGYARELSRARETSEHARVSYNAVTAEYMRRRRAKQRGERSFGYNANGRLAVTVITHHHVDHACVVLDLWWGASPLGVPEVGSACSRSPSRQCSIPARHGDRHGGSDAAQHTTQGY